MSRSLPPEQEPDFGALDSLEVPAPKESARADAIAAGLAAFDRAAAPAPAPTAPRLSLLEQLKGIEASLWGQHRWLAATALVLVVAVPAGLYVWRTPPDSAPNIAQTASDAAKSEASVEKAARVGMEAEDAFAEVGPSLEGLIAEPEPAADSAPLNDNVVEEQVTASLEMQQAEDRAEAIAPEIAPESVVTSPPPLPKAAPKPQMTRPADQTPAPMAAPPEPEPNVQSLVESDQARIATEDEAVEVMNDNGADAGGLAGGLTAPAPPVIDEASEAAADPANEATGLQPKILDTDGLLSALSLSLSDDLIGSSNGLREAVVFPEAPDTVFILIGSEAEAPAGAATPQWRGQDLRALAPIEPLAGNESDQDRAARAPFQIFTPLGTPAGAETGTAALTPFDTLAPDLRFAASAGLFLARRAEDPAAAGISYEALYAHALQATADAPPVGQEAIERLNILKEMSRWARPDAE
ncbi:MAG: hypothetical protein AAGB03_11460 [Pseudomonadota bacterium]